MHIFKIVLIVSLFSTFQMYSIGDLAAFLPLLPVEKITTDDIVAYHAPGHVDVVTNGKLERIIMTSVVGKNKNTNTYFGWYYSPPDLQKRIEILSGNQKDTQIFLDNIFYLLALMSSF